MKFRPGDLVLVPWGFDTVEGTVVAIYGPSEAPLATVRVTLPGPGDDLATEELTFRADALRPAPAVA